MGVAERIKSVLRKVGSQFNIINIDGSESSTEYLDIRPNTQATKPFIREFFLEATMGFDTRAVSGNVVNIPTLSNKYLVMNLTPSPYKNGVAENQAVLYKVNVSGELRRQSGEFTRNSRYKNQVSFPIIHTDVYATLTEIAIGTDLDETEEYMPVSLQNYTLFVPSQYGAIAGDRYYLSSGEYYKIETVMPRRFNDVDMCELGADQR